MSFEIIVLLTKILLIWNGKEVTTFKAAAKVKISASAWDSTFKGRQPAIRILKLEDETRNPPLQTRCVAFQEDIEKRKGPSELVKFERISFLQEEFLRVLRLALAYATALIAMTGKLGLIGLKMASQRAFQRNQAARAMTTLTLIE